MAAVAGPRGREVEDLNAFRNPVAQFQRWQSLVQDDPKGAFEWLQSSAQRQHLPALLEVGRCYEQGIGTSKDKWEAFKAYEKAANLGSAEGRYEAGRCCEGGIGVQVDRGRAAAYYQLAAEKEYAVAQRALGLWFMRSDPPCLGPANRWLQKAAVRNDAEAQYYLGFNCEKGNGFNKPDRAAAIFWYQRAADQGHVAAQKALRCMNT